jgi:hypothetical protein
MIHNGCYFKIVRYYNDRAVIKIQSIDGSVLQGADEDTPYTLFVDEKVDNLTTNLGGGFEEWVKDNY